MKIIFYQHNDTNTNTNTINNDNNNHTNNVDNNNTITSNNSNNPNSHTHTNIDNNLDKNIIQLTIERYFLYYNNLYNLNICNYLITEDFTDYSSTTIAFINEDIVNINNDSVSVPHSMSIINSNLSFVYVNIVNINNDDDQFNSDPPVLIANVNNNHTDSDSGIDFSLLHLLVFLYEDIL
ncbi:unnamed protein product [Cunninghamella blakesleeana]